MIDVHLIIHPKSERSDSLERMLRALELEPVTVHLVPGDMRMIGKSRAEGFRMGTHELVSFVDDDDAIEPGIFDKILEAFEKDSSLDGVCTREEIIQNGVNRGGWGITTPHGFEYYNRFHYMNIHHLVTYKRASIEKHLDYIIDIPTASEHTLCCLALIDGARIKHLPVVGYYWNQHSGSTPSIAMSQNEKTKLMHDKIMQISQSENFISHIPDQRALPWL